MLNVVRQFQTLILRFALRWGPQPSCSGINIVLQKKVPRDLLAKIGVDIKIIAKLLNVHLFWPKGNFFENVKQIY